MRYRLALAFALTILTGCERSGSDAPIPTLADRRPSPPSPTPILTVAIQPAPQPADRPVADIPVTQDPSGWLMFRGSPLQTGVAKADLPDQLREVWKFKAEEGFEGAVAIADGTVYAACADEHLYAIDLGDGSLKWKVKLGSMKAPPTIVGKRLLVGGIEGTFFCVDRADGKTLWTFETNGEITSGSTVTGDAVLFGSHDQTLYCLNLSDGKEKWNFKTEGPVYGTPAVVGERTFVAGCDSQLHIVDIKKGVEIDKVDLGSQSQAATAVVGDHLYVGTYGKQVLAIDWKKAEVTWKYEAAKRKGEFYSSAAVTDSLVLIGSRDRQLHAIDRRTGKGKWTFLADRDVDCSPVVVGERVYFGANDKRFYVLDLDGKERQRIKLDGGVTASPAVAEDKLVIATEGGTVYCFGK